MNSKITNGFAKSRLWDKELKSRTKQKQSCTTLEVWFKPNTQISTCMWYEEIHGFRNSSNTEINWGYDGKSNNRGRSRQNYKGQTCQEACQPQSQ